MNKRNREQEHWIPVHEYGRRNGIGDVLLLFHVWPACLFHVPPDSAYRKQKGIKSHEHGRRDRHGQEETGFLFPSLPIVCPIEVSGSAYRKQKRSVSQPRAGLLETKRKTLTLLIKRENALCQASLIFNKVNVNKIIIILMCQRPISGFPLFY